MAITTYAELQTKLTTYTWRTGDVQFGNETADMIKMAESRLNRILPLRVTEAEVTLTGTVGSRQLTLPASFQEPLRFQRTTDNLFEDMAPFTIEDLPVSAENGTPLRYAIDGERRIKLECPCDRAHTFLLRYRGRLDLEATDSNWLLDNHPDVYLAACCVWGGVFMRDREEAGQWKSILDEAVNELSWIESRSKAIAPLRVDPALNIPRQFNIMTGE